MKRILIIILVQCLIITACARWKTTKLKSDQLCTIPNGDVPGKIMLKYDKDDILEISFKIYTRNNIVAADNILKRVTLMDRNGKPLMYIGEKAAGSRLPSDIIFSKFQFNIIKDIALDSNGNLYVQNSFSLVNTNSNKKIYNTETGITPSYILIFDRKGILSHTLGKTGSPDIPFNSIESIKIDNKDRLFVVSRSYNIWSIYRFVEKRRDFNVNITEADFKEIDGEESLSAKIEKILIYESGDYILIPVAFYKETEFKYRKIFQYSIQNEKLEKELFTVYDPKNEVFSVVNDKLIYLWDINDKRIRFIVNTFEGNTINNLAIDLPGSANSYNDILIDDNAQIYTYRAQKGGISITEWR